MTIQNRLLMSTRDAMSFYREDDSLCCRAPDPSGLCATCRGHYDGLLARGVIEPRAATRPKPAKMPAVMRAACPRGSDGRTAEERAADAELVAGLRKHGVDRLRSEEPAAEDRTPARAARRRPSIYPEDGSYSRALGRSITRPRALQDDGEPPPVVTPEERAENREDDAEVQRLYGIILAGLPFLTEDTLLRLDRETLEQWAEQILAEREETERAAAAAPRGYSKALAARRTAEQRDAAEIDATSRETELTDGKPWGYSREIARRETLAEIRSGREAPLERPRRHDPGTPPKGYTAALRRREEVAA